MALSTNEKVLAREARKKRVRKKIEGKQNRPRLCLYKSNRYIYAQLIDDLAGVTIVSATSVKFKEQGKLNCKNVNIATKVGQELGNLAIQKGIKKIVLDRSGYPYHGIVKALADGVREQGIEF